MNKFAAIYAQRKRQVVVVMIVGAVSLAVSVLSAKLLPTVLNLQPATDGKTLYLAAQALPAVPPEVTFVLARSSDGSTFSAPTVRGGVVQGLTAEGGRLHALFSDGSVLSLGEKPDDWSSVPWTLDWTPLGLTTLDNALTALGQSADRSKILTATRDNDTWRPGAPFDLACDNITFFMGARSKGVDVLAWAELVTPPAAEGKRLGPQERAMVPDRVGLARFSDGKLELLSRRDFDRAIALTVLGDNEGVHLYYQTIVGVGPMSVELDPTMRVTTFADGRWTEPRVVALDRPWWLRPGDFTAASFGGKTFIYTTEYVFGVLYVGTWGREMRPTGQSEPFLAMPPTAQDLTLEIRWGLMAVAASFIAAGALAAFVARRGRPDAPPKGPVVYAAVSDRATAAMLDLALLYALMQLLVGEADPAHFWTTLAVGYFVYGTMMETMAGGQTLAKKLLGLRVLNATGGGPVTFQAALARNAFKLVEMLTVGAGMCLGTDRFQRPGDFLARTIVVKEFPRVEASK